jgi:[ribosomal protein S5]-alanine N-acetyltransferase
MRIGGLELIAPRSGDATEFLKLVDESRPYHEGLVEPPATRESFAAYVRRSKGPTHAGFLVWTEGRLIGAVNLNNIVRGALESGSLGYYRLGDGGHPGALRSAVSAVADHAFDSLGLHRLEANIQPSNTRSRELVEALGFRLEGLSVEYLRVGGQWQNHERWALLAHEWKA